MNKRNSAIKLLALLGVVAIGGQAQAGVTSEISKAAKDSKVNLDMRYRYETVDQDGIDEDASASTVKTRLTVKTGKVRNFSAVIEADHVADLGADDYNDATGTGNTDYPVVADPTGFDLNQAYIKYTGFENTALMAGRQRIVHNNQRFLGGVAWRQNEQTYDGYRINHKASDALNFDYSYFYNVNRIFGSDSSKGDLGGDFHALNVKFAPAKGHKVAAFAYLLDFDTAHANSTDTYGIDYQYSTKLSGKNKMGVHLSYATQSDAGDNPTSYTANYMLAEVNANLSGIGLAAGYEVMGSDDGVAAFKTPLATLHKFQGFADKFLGTPADGIEDVYFKVGGKAGPIKLTAIYHDFSANEGSRDLGSELDLVAAYKMNKQVSLLAKYASYDADDHASDTDKLWLMGTFKF